MQSDNLEGEEEEVMVDLLSAAGFKKQLNNATIPEARTALLLHYGFYMFLGPLLQYMDGNYNSIWLALLQLLSKIAKIAKIALYCVSLFVWTISHNNYILGIDIVFCFVLLSCYI